MIIRFTCEYDGATFSGFQRQKNATSVQGVLENALERALGQKITLHASGRTDAGVHASGQVCSFKYPGSLICYSDAKGSGEESSVSTTLEGKPVCFFKLQGSVNSFLPKSIRIRDIGCAPDNFNARFDVQAKIYVYKCYISRIPSPLRDTQMMQLHSVPNMELMRAAAEQLVGRHDFTSFSSTKTDKQDKIRTIHSINITAPAHDEIHFAIRGDGFLRNMVRIIIGTLLDVGNLKTCPLGIKEILDARNRERAGTTAPAHGLCLIDVEY